MPTVPEVGSALDVLEDLVDQVRRALVDPPSPERCRELLAALNRVGEMGIWARDAGLQLGRLTSPPIKFREMQAITGVSDATLHDRYSRWIKTEGGDA